MTFASAAYAAKKKTTEREHFLAEMAAFMQWATMQALIEQHSQKTGLKGGRPPIGLARMIRV